jgi:hypothetical protein
MCGKKVGAAESDILSGSPSAAQVGCKVVGRDEGVGMVVTQHPAAPGQGVLVECAGPLILAQLAQVNREPAHCGEGIWVVVAQDCCSTPTG